MANPTSLSVYLHVYEGTEFKLNPLSTPERHLLRIGELGVFFDRPDLRRLRDAIDAHLGDNVVPLRAAAAEEPKGAA